MIAIAQVSDVHLDGSPERARRARAVMDRLRAAPAPLHTELADTIRLAGEDRLAAVISRHPQVVAVLCGHAHTAAATTSGPCWSPRAYCPPA
jgi:3',5'-cyclic AMP phosphodiesterase CpdA